MARNQGSFTVVVKRSRRTIEKGRLSRPPAARSDMPALRGWAERAGDTDMAALSGSNQAEGTATGQARRAAEKLFASRKPVEARILPTITVTAMPFEAAVVEPGIEPIAVSPFEALRSEIVDAAPIPPRPDGAATKTTTAPSADRRAMRQSERPALPLGQRWLEGLPESCWPEAVRRAARRNRRRTNRTAAKGGQPVQ